MLAERRNEIVEDILGKCKETLTAKGADYAGREDVNANFKRNAERLGLTKYQIWAVYFNKHIDSVNNSIKYNPNSPQTESEELLFRVVDIINYSLILAAMLEEDGLLDIEKTEP